MHNVVVVDTEFLCGHHDRMELAALAILADTDHPLSWIAHVALDGRRPTQEQVQVLYDRLADVVDLDERLGE